MFWRKNETFLPSTKFIVGTGNPEKKYDGTRHNAGFAVLDRLAGKARWEKKNALAADAAVLDSGTVLLKPRTYVNKTGQTAGALKNGRDFKAEALLIVCDDVNLDFGKLRLRKSGGAGGHHGIESVIASLGTEEFPRLRVGVRNETMPSDLAGYVLEKFGSDEEKVLGEIIDRAAAVCEAWAGEGFDAALNRLSRLQSDARGF